MKKLVLAKETLRRLGTHALDHVIGAMPGEGWTGKCRVSNVCPSVDICTDAPTCHFEGTITKPGSITKP